jgi:transcriptional regulator with XRE-family HTH domain
MTEFGKLLRKVRIETDEMCREMADKFDMSPAYLSAIERGNRNIPIRLLDFVEREYGIEKEVLFDAFIKSKNEVDICLKSLDTNKLEMVILLKDKMASLDDEKVRQIIEILKG